MLQLGRDVWNQLLGGFRGLFQWLLDYIIGTGTNVLGWVIDELDGMIPEAANLDLTVLTPYVAAVNAWVPLDLGVTLCGTYISIYAFVAGIKWLLKLIPGLG